MTCSSALGPAGRVVRCEWKNSFEGTGSPGVWGGVDVSFVTFEVSGSEDVDTAVSELVVDPCKVGSETEVEVIISVLETSITTDG